MKKIICLLLFCLMFVSLFGCGQNSSKPADKKQSSADTSSVDIKQDENTVDVDLTKLSSTMVYSEVYNMMSNPETYVGKTVRMQGTFAAFSNDDQSKFYPAVVIADATACCSQGIEFILKGDKTYPQDYPEMDSNVTVVGTFEQYDENGVKYNHLVDSMIEA